MIKIAVVDDSDMDCRIIQKMLGKYTQENPHEKFDITVCHSGGEFFRIYRKGAFHIIFLDICMCGMDGIEISERLRTGDENIRIVFMSSDSDYVFEVFQSQPTGFLCKPYTYEKFLKSFELALNYFRKKEKMFTVKLPRILMPVAQNEILSAVSDNHCTVISLVTGDKYSSISTYSEVSGILLQEPNFIECNRGIIINMNYTKFNNDMKNDDSLTMQDGTVYPVRVRGRKQVMAQISAYHISGKIV